MTTRESGHTRHCGSCTACCDGWLRITVRGHHVHPGTPCPFSTGSACSIYQERPVHPCHEFVCGWLEAGSPLPEEYRPDKIGVIFVRMTWRGIPVYVLTPAGADPTADVLEWAKEFSLTKHRPILYKQNDEWYAFGPQEFQREMLQKIAQGNDLW